jgi:hypothetical protein
MVNNWKCTFVQILLSLSLSLEIVSIEILNLQQKQKHRKQSLVEGSKSRLLSLSDESLMKFDFLFLDFNKRQKLGDWVTMKF